VLNLVNFLLDIVERPLLRLLHLYHHLLNLFELLEAVCLHLFKLLLLRHEHLKASVIIASEKSVFNFPWAFFTLSLFNGLDSRIRVLNPVLVKAIFFWLFIRIDHEVCL
jgi:hypothetical protein